MRHKTYFHYYIQLHIQCKDLWDLAMKGRAIFIAKDNWRDD